MFIVVIVRTGVGGISRGKRNDAKEEQCYISYIYMLFQSKKNVQYSKIKYCIARENNMLLRATNPISVFVLFIAYGI